VVSGVDGLETNIFWKRVDDGTRPGYAEIQRNGEKLFSSGEVVAFLPHEIHSVVNETEAVTVSLHTYGKHLNYTGRSQFDPEASVEKPFLVKEQ
jgi:predicted metal-dependent enzyme (double-stranded beta helix superfamily)